MSKSKVMVLLFFVFVGAVWSDVSLGSGGGTSVNRIKSLGSDQQDPVDAAIQYRVIPFDQFALTDELPPRLSLEFSLTCYQEFISLVRYDKKDPTTGKVTILVGGLVSEFLLLPCTADLRPITVDGGPSFSGVDFEIEKIN
jgi:hypothetical protein